MKINPTYSAKPKGEDLEKIHVTMQKGIDTCFLACTALSSTLLCKEVLYMLCTVAQAAQQT